MLELREYVDELGRSRYAQWLKSLEAAVATRVLVFLARLEHGNISALKTVGAGVSELRMDFGPGYRLYVGRDGQQLVLLLGSGTKRKQQDDIDQAKASWFAYKRRKAAGEL